MRAVLVLAMLMASMLSRIQATQAAYTAIPPGADIIFAEDGDIKVKDFDTGTVTTLVHTSRFFEHVAARRDRAIVIATTKDFHAFVYDLAAGTESELLSSWALVGIGGVDFDSRGNAYLVCVDILPYPNPTSREEYLANADAQEVYMVASDFSGVSQVTDMIDRGLADVATSPDGSQIIFHATDLTDPEGDGYNTGIWIAGVDGSNPTQIVYAEAFGLGSVHDPEIAAGNQDIVYSQVASTTEVCGHPEHRIWTQRGDGSELRAVTEAGVLSVIPDVKVYGDSLIILYFECDPNSSPTTGINVVKSDGTGLTRVHNGGGFAKWISP